MTSTVVPEDIRHPSSSAYKKAKRQFLKSTRNRGDVERDWTPFRAAEKRYKAQFPPPDLSNVLDLALLSDGRRDQIKQTGWYGCINCTEYKEISLRPDVVVDGLDDDDSDEIGKRRAYVIPRIPGLVIIPGFLSPKRQKQLVRWALCEQARQPNDTNLDTHYIVPESGIWNTYIDWRNDPSDDALIQPRVPTSRPASQIEPPGPRTLTSNAAASPENYDSLVNTPKPPAVPSTTVHPASAAALLPKLRWANIGWYYHWGTKQYDFSRGKGRINEDVRWLCKNIVSRINWEDVFGSENLDDQSWGVQGPDWMNWSETYDPDAGIVNYYQTRDTLMAHVDRSELCATSPLVSVSLGNAAVFLIGGQTRDSTPVPFLLRSGDVVVMSGPMCRRAYHGVPRILENTLPVHLKNMNTDDHWTAYAEYLQTTRINVNVRQVFPKGFDPTSQEERREGTSVRTI